MTSMLPPTRDLPPGRHARIRAELERAAAGRRRRLLFPVLAGVASIAAVAASVALLSPAPGPPSPAVQITSSPPETPKSPDFGVPPDTVAAIEKGCSRIAGTGDAKLYQLLDGETRWALLYSDNAALGCTLGQGGMEYNSGFSGTDVRWLPGLLAVDESSATAGGDLNLKPAYAGMPGTRTVAGRVDPRVARVTYTIDGKTVEASVANGTFAVRIHYPSSWTIPNDDVRGVLNAYDAQGVLLVTLNGYQPGCWVDPGGRIVQGDRRADPLTCKPAVAWTPR
ncbi:hypothetical protein [Lentzea sp. NPDC003310]|uniref:hypothetical protein n=1 Tax=Lentzea sp. NPDC003310 TaxID=3154447 RepID=UPI0033B2DB6F